LFSTYIRRAGDGGGERVCKNYFRCLRGGGNRVSRQKRMKGGSYHEKKNHGLQKKNQKNSLEKKRENGKTEIVQKVPIKRGKRIHPEGNFTNSPAWTDCNQKLDPL